MRKQFIWSAILVWGVLLVGFVWLHSSRSVGPSYNGRTMSEWMERLPASDYKTKGIVWGGISAKHNAGAELEAEEAVRHIGTNALPFLMSELRVNGDPPAAIQWFLNAAKHLASRNWGPFNSANYKTRGEIRHWKAACALHALGPMARPVIPELGKLLVSGPGSTDCCDGAAYALSTMGSQGLAELLKATTNSSPMRGDWPELCAIWAMGQTPECGRQAIPQLLGLIHDKDATVRMAVVWTLGELHTNQEVIAPAIAANLGDSGFNMRSMGEEALAKYGITSVTLHSLENDLTNSTLHIRMAATNAMLALYPKEAEAEGIK